MKKMNKNGHSKFVRLVITLFLCIIITTILINQYVIPVNLSLVYVRPIPKMRMDLSLYQPYTNLDKEFNKAPIVFTAENYNTYFPPKSDTPWSRFLDKLKFCFPLIFLYIAIDSLKSLYISCIKDEDSSKQQEHFLTAWFMISVFILTFSFVHT